MARQRSKSSPSSSICSTPSSARSPRIYSVATSIAYLPTAAFSRSASGGQTFRSNWQEVPANTLLSPSDVDLFYKLQAVSNAQRVRQSTAEGAAEGANGERMRGYGAKLNLTCSRLSRASSMPLKSPVRERRRSQVGLTAFYARPPIWPKPLATTRSTSRRSTRRCGHFGSRRHPRFPNLSQKTPYPRL